MPLSFRIAAWRAWPAEEIALPLALRRRATALGQRALKTALSVLPPDVSPRYVLSSRHGEITRTVGLLTSLAEADEVSPAEFSMAVHHGLAGLLSIHTGNRQGHTAIAAGADSFGYGLIESAAIVAESGKPVLHLHFDEPLPDMYAPVAGDPDDDTILALRLDPAAGEAFALDRVPRRTDGTESLAAGFVEFLRSGARDGGSGAWRWSRDD